MTPAHLAYAWLEAKRQWRNREALIFRLGLPTALHLILTATSADDDTIEASGLPSATARMVALAALGGLISGLAAGPALAEERANGWLRHLRVTPLRSSVVVAAKIAVAMSFALPSIALVVSAAAVTEGNALPWEGWIELIGLMWLATIPLTALGTLIGLAFAAEVANAANTLAFLILWLLGGIFTEPANMPDALAAMSKGLPSYGLVQVGWSSTNGDAIPAAAFAVLVAWTIGAGVLATLTWRRVVTR